MFVIDDTAFARNPCGHGTLFTIGSDTHIENDNGARLDTSALAVGRRVSVFVTDNTILLESCPPGNSRREGDRPLSYRSRQPPNKRLKLTARVD